jgi:GDP/UDP-N,N'-diacetylbacillosamine 2-epimerase (hydrolysing)
MKKKVLAVTGIRSEYDILAPVLRVLRDDPDFEVRVIVTGAHLSDWHGNTAERIEQEGFVLAERIDYLLMTNRETQRSKGVGILIQALTQTVERESPDFLLFVGDREESIATCVVGNYMDTLVAHIGGGDPVYGNADDPIRFACSKLAHIHFTTTQAYADNLVSIGEDKFRICNTGNPALRNILDVAPLALPEISQRLGFDITDGRYMMLLKHPLSSEKSEAYDQMRCTLDAVEAFAGAHDVKVVGIYPNTDPGAYDILRAIDAYEDSPRIRFFRTLPTDTFVNLMRHALCLVGNSSMGILEAPMYKLPVVNVGRRQSGRLNAGNVRFVDYDPDLIGLALREACFDTDYRRQVATLDNPYGDGSAPERIREFLRAVDSSDTKWHVKTRLCP